MSDVRANEPLAASDSDLIVDIRNLDMIFGTKSGRVIALENISMDIRRGEFFVIVGPSGCGKSTLMLLVAGILSQTSGTLLVGGKSLHGPYTEAGIAFQHHNLLEWRTVLNNVLLPLEIRGEKGPASLARAHELIEMVGLKGFENHYPHQLSGGMCQRAALCRALVCGLPLLLMDEPFGALDALTREEHQLMLQDLWLHDRRTVLLITHDVREAVLLADRVAVMSARPGRLRKIVTIDLPRPRDQEISETVEFNRYVHEIRAELFDAGHARPRRGGAAA
ncbi:MAG: ABC transporter ATP-binding protein [Rhodospirillales bacterium]